MTFTLLSEDLLSKWGFRDGNLFDEFAYDHYGSKGSPSSHAILVAAVKAYLLPKLKQSVVIVEIATTHNPIRAERVDGCDVDWYSIDPGTKLEPGSIEVSEQDLLALFPCAFRGMSGVLHTIKPNGVCACVAPGQVDLLCTKCDVRLRLPVIDAGIAAGIAVREYGWGVLPSGYVICHACTATSDALFPVNSACLKY